MKTKIKRHSRAVMSVILAVSMLISCMTVGLIATDAAKVTDDEALGAATYYLYYRTDNRKDLSGMTAVQMTASGSNYVASFTMPTGKNFDLGIGISSTPSSTMVTSSWTVKKDSGINFANIEDNNGTRYIVGSVKTSGTVTVTYTPSSTISLTTAGGGSDGSSQYCLTGDSAITGTSGWTNNTTTNKLEFNSTSKIYTITKTVSFTSGTFNFRITDFGSWTNTFNFEKANLVNTAGIVTTWQVQPNSTDKNIQMQLSQAATIEIRLDDSKSDTSAVTVIVTPTTSTVTAAVSPAGAGTATVNGVESATATYGGTVSLSATAANYYVFKNWSTTDNKVSIAGSSAASTTATVYGTDTVTANFDKASYTVSKGTGTGDTGAFTITTPSANQSKQWDTTVNVAASVSSDLYCIDYLYYLNNNTGVEEKLGTVTDSTSSPAAAADGAGTASSMTGTFKMPKNNVTVYAHTHKRETKDFTYGYVTGCEGMGYINVGKQHDSSDTQIEYSIDSPGSVIEGTTVLFGARAKAGYKFLGWYSDQAGNNAISGMDVADKAVTNPTGTYYAKFAQGTESPLGNATTTYYPVKLSVTNPDLGAIANGSTGAYTDNYFVEAESDAKIYAQPQDTDNNKTRYQLVSGTTNVDVSVTDTNKTGKMKASAEALNATITYISKEYYKVNFSAGAGGTVKASTGSTAYAAANDIKTGTSVKEGTAIAFEATPASGYEVAGWEGDVTGTGTTKSIAAADFTSEKTVRVYFKKGKGTKSTGTYFGYFFSSAAPDNSDNNANPDSFNVYDAYTFGGHTYGYIDTISSSDQSKYIYIAAFSSKASSTENKYKEMYYYGSDDDPWIATDFTADITNIGRRVKSGWDKNAKYVCFKVSSKVKGIIVDIGESKSDGSTTVLSNCYRVIPVYNTDVGKVTVYAKDGTYRADSIYDYMPTIADTVITNPASGGGVTNISSQLKFNTAVAEKGKKITVTTTIDSGANNRDRFYVKGFSFNGVTPELYTENGSGEYTCTYTIPEDFEDDYLEITPIYFMRDSYLETEANGATAMTFYIENYDQNFQDTGWGNTLSVYPFYSTADNPVNSKANVFGGYPGMPVINYGGRRFVQIPTTYKLAVDSVTKENEQIVTKDTAGTAATIKGITLSNYYWDMVHRNYCREVDEHLQTYDYDDFYKIYHETTKGHEINEKEGTANQITFAFKYRNEIDNFGATNRITAGDTLPATIDIDDFDDENGNGWEQLLDYHDRPINIFGKILSTAEQANDPIYVVSNGYEYTHAGNYATTYTAYYNNNGTYTKITTITPSALIISDKNDFADYPDSPQVTGGPALLQIDDQNENYVALQSYATRPVMITYEKAIKNSKTSGTGQYYHSALGEIATRSDGRWFYSYMNEEINANLRIDYGDEDYGDNYDRWSHDTFKAGTNTGVATGATVHFTNDATAADDGGYDLSPYHDTADYDDPIYSNFNNYYKFVASDGAGYIFMGWYMDRDGIQTAVTPENIKQYTGKSQMTSNATFVARYVKNPAGHLTIKHTIADGSTGAGTTYIKIEKSTDGSNWTNVTGGFVRQDAYSINDTDVMSYNSGYILRVTLKTVVDSDTAFNRFSASDATGDHSSDYFSNEVTTDGDTATTSFEIPVNDLFELVNGFPQQKDNYDTFTYFSHTEKKPELTISHNIDPTSDASAAGTAYLKVEVTNDSGDHVAWINDADSDSDVYETGKNIVVPSSYYYSNSGYRLKVYLKTEMTEFTQFDQFSVLDEVLGNHASTLGASVNISDADNMHTKLATIELPISSLFNNGEPRFTELPYLSKLIMPDYKYQITYKYPSYLKNSDGTYSQQSYTTKDSFAPEDLNTYMRLTNNDLAFQSDDDKKTFACSKAPYEDNFQKLLDWSVASFGNRSYSQETHTLTLEVIISEAQQQTLSVVFDFPYKTDIEHSNSYNPVTTDSKVIKTESNKISKSGIYGRDWFNIRGARNDTFIEQDGQPSFVEAPLNITDTKNTDDTNDDEDLYFKYWSVKTEATATDPAREFTRCYDYEFNLAIFQNCVITPEYDNISFEERGKRVHWLSYSGNGIFDPQDNWLYYSVCEPDYSEGENGVSITFLENSRNQWNNNGGGSNDTTRHGAGDRIYSDFLLTFDNDRRVKRDMDPDTMQAGLIIQPVAYLEEDDNGGYIERTDSYYQTADGYAGASQQDIERYLTEGTPVSRIQRSKFDAINLDNKNRIQYYYGIDNAAAKPTSATADSDGIIRVGNTYNNQKVVYKAFAYIGYGAADDDTLTDVTVSSRPVYFTIYTDATIAPGFYMPSGS